MTFFSRYTVLFLCLLLALGGWFLHWPWILPATAAALALLGLRDLIQRRHSIQRNYPIIGHIRWMVELIRPEIRQYLLEGQEEGAPFSRAQRSLVYERSKG